MLQVPRVFVKAKPIGGCKEIEQLSKDGNFSLKVHNFLFFTLREVTSYRPRR